MKLDAGWLSERLAGAKGASRAGVGACQLCESGGWGERSEQSARACGNAGTGKHGRARKFIAWGGLAVAVFPHSYMGLLLCFWAKGLLYCCKPNCFGAILTAFFLCIFGVSSSAFCLLI